jgi:hypothetical protein
MSSSSYQNELIWWDIGGFLGWWKWNLTKGRLHGFSHDCRVLGEVPGK